MKRTKGIEKNLEETRIVRKDFLVILFLLFNALSWFYMMHIIVNTVLSDLNATYEQNFIIWAVYSMAIIGSSVAGSILSKELPRLNFIYVWMILGAVVSLMPAAFGILTVTHVLLLAILFGISFGLGMPSCLAYFSDHTRVENRGRRSGVTLAITNLTAPLFAVALSISNLQVNSIIFAAWRATGLIIFFLKPEEQSTLENRRNGSFISVLHNRSFVLYFIAWLMFCLVDSFEWPVLRSFFGEFHYSIFILGPLIASFSALIAGVLSDRVGRKRMVLYGFVALGIAYAVISLFPHVLFSWYSYLVIDSIATGILWVSFILIIWGDLSQPGTREEYYVIGETPYFLSDIIQPLSAPLVLIPASSAFSLASLFLFLAVLPLLYAPETLPEKKIELRRLRKYVEAARKVKEKHKE